MCTTSHDIGLELLCQRLALWPPLALLALLVLTEYPYAAGARSLRHTRIQTRVPKLKTFLGGLTARFRLKGLKEAHLSRGHQGAER